MCPGKPAIRVERCSFIDRHGFLEDGRRPGNPSPAACTHNAGWQPASWGWRRQPYSLTRGGLLVPTCQSGRQGWGVESGAQGQMLVPTVTAGNWSVLWYARNHALVHCGVWLLKTSHFTAGETEGRELECSWVRLTNGQCECVYEGETNREKQLGVCDNHNPEHL